MPWLNIVVGGEKDDIQIAFLSFVISWLSKTLISYEMHLSSLSSRFPVHLRVFKAKRVATSLEAGRLTWKVPSLESSQILIHFEDLFNHETENFELNCEWKWPGRMASLTLNAQRLIVNGSVKSKLVSRAFNSRRAYAAPAGLGLTSSFSIKGNAKVFKLLVFCWAPRSWNSLFIFQKSASKPRSLSAQAQSKLLPQMLNSWRAPEKPSRR